jgi:hypothetical protein
MKINFNSLCLIILFFIQHYPQTGHTQSVQFNWVRKAGGIGVDNGQSITTDALGNVYSTGFFQGNIDMDPGPGVTAFTSHGLGDIYVQKLDPMGNLVWALQFGGSGDDIAYAINKDAQGNILVGGYFSDTVDVDPGLGVTNLIANGSTDIFLLRLTPTGQLSWASGIGGPFDDGANAIYADPNGNIYSTGYFGSTVDFDPSANTFTISSQGVDDAYFLKLSPTGNLIWAKSIGSTNYQVGYVITTDAASNVYIGGYYYNTVDFDPGPAQVMKTNVGLTDIFIEKLDVAGNFVWVKTMGSAGFEGLFAMSLDKQGNIYSAGFFQQTVDFNPNAAVFNLSATGGSDIFIQKLDTSGAFIWAKKIGGVGWDEINSFVLDSIDNIYATGFFRDTVDFDPGPNMMIFNSIGNRDIFVLKLDSAANFLWAKQMGGTGDDWGNGIAIDPFGNVFTTGFYENLVDFNPGPGVSNLLALADDIFVQKLTPCSPSYNSIIRTACNSYQLNGQTFTLSGTYLQQLTNAATCDSFLTIHLTINHTTNSLLQQTICFGQSFFFNNQTITASGTYYDTLINAAACDSIITLQLQVLPNNLTHLYQSICASASFLFNGNLLSASGVYYDTLISYRNCDSIITLHLTVLANLSGSFTQAICSGDFYFYNGHTITLPGNYLDTLTSYLGCDSILTLHLQVMPASASSFSHTNCHGQGFLFNNQLLIHTGTYLDTLTNYLGCDSLLTLQLTELAKSDTVFKVSICSGSNYNFNGNIISASGVYQDTLQNINGCDSIVQLFLTVITPQITTVTQYVCAGNTLQNYVDTIPSYIGCDSIYQQVTQVALPALDTSITTNGLQLNANAIGIPAYTYQWVYQFPYQVLAGANQAQYIALVNGYYAVIISDTLNHCTDTSNWYYLNSLAIHDLLDKHTIKVQPNLIKDFCEIEINGDGNYTVVLFDDKGSEQLPLLKSKAAGIYKLNLTGFASGNYYLQFKENRSKQHFTKKLVIQ